jgi:hypothetical protein
VLKKHIKSYCKHFVGVDQSSTLLTKCLYFCPPQYSSVNAGLYKRWFRKNGQYFGRWHYRSLLEEKLHMNMILILNGFWVETAVSRWNAMFVRLLFVGLDEQRSLQKNGWYTRRIARPHFGCCCPSIKTWRSTQTNSARSSNTSWKLHWGWRWDFRELAVNL